MHQLLYYIILYYIILHFIIIYYNKAILTATACNLIHVQRHWYFYAAVYMCTLYMCSLNSN